MCPSYMRIRLPLKQALDRLSEWLERPLPEPPHEVSSQDAFRLAYDGQGQTTGFPLFVYQVGDWTVFRDFLSGGFSGVALQEWQKLAETDDLVFAAYNDAVGYGELIVLSQGQVVRYFVAYPDAPEESRNIGSLPERSKEPIEDWVGVAGFLDDDSIIHRGSDRGLLWLH